MRRGAYQPRIAPDTRSPRPRAAYFKTTDTSFETPFCSMVTP